MSQCIEQMVRPGWGTDKRGVIGVVRAYRNDPDSIWLHARMPRRAVPRAEIHQADAEETRAIWAEIVHLWRTDRARLLKTIAAALVAVVGAWALVAGLIIGGSK